MIGCTNIVLVEADDEADAVWTGATSCWVSTADGALPLSVAVTSDAWLSLSGVKLSAVICLHLFKLKITKDSPIRRHRGVLQRAVAVAVAAAAAEVAEIAIAAAAVGNAAVVVAVAAVAAAAAGTVASATQCCLCWNPKVCGKAAWAWPRA